MENKVISQKEYLKKYLSSGNSSDKKKKKKKKPKIVQQTVKVIDDDLDLKSMRPIKDDEFDILLDSEDAPQIVGVIYERGSVDFSDRRRWKIIAKDDDGDIMISSIDKEEEQDDVVNDKFNDNNSKSAQYYSDVDVDQARSRTRFSDDDLSPPRVSNFYKSNDKHSKCSDLRTDSIEKLSKKDVQNKLISNNSSMSREYGDSDSDLSPPRQGKFTDSDASLPRRNNHDLNRSPLTRGRKNEDSDLSSRKRKIEYESADLSPPRRDKHNDSNSSTPRKSEKSRNSDSRSERHSRKHRRSTSPYERSQRDRNSDTGKHKRTDEYDSSRKSRSYKDSRSRHDKRRDSDKSPSHKRSYESRSHCSVRKSKGSSRDVYDNSGSDNRSSKSEYYRKCSSDCGSLQSREKSSSRWRSENESNEETSRYDKRMKKTLDGKTAGLQDAKALREETEAHKKREAEQFRKLSKEVSGVGQETIVRDRKTGRKRNLEAEAAEEREKEERQAELDEKYSVWGKGVKQVRDREEKLKDDFYEMSKPLARYADDADLDKALRQQEREGDPMLEYIKQKQIKEGKRKPDLPRYEGTLIPNRFGIKPGHRWDGVDRSNGYEKRWFEAQNAKVARQEEAYKWSTSDM